MKPDKYNIFNRECPYKEEWVKIEDKERYEKTRKKIRAKFSK